MKDSSRAAVAAPAAAAEETPAAPGPIIVEARALTKVYPMGKTEVRALRGVDIDIRQGERVFIGGPSGSGKSTLLHTLGCLDLPTSGTLRIFGQDVAAIDDDRLSGFRAKNIGFVFQGFNLIPVLSVADNVEYPLLLCQEKDRKDRVRQVLKEVGLEKYAGHYPNELSGGQCQRVAIARALVTEANLLIADEPTANLDSENGKVVLDLMFDLSARKGTTLVICTHNDELLRSGGRVVYLRDGLIAEDSGAGAGKGGRHADA